MSAALAVPAGVYDLVLAHHALAVALPFFAPALAVLAVGGVVWRDRHTPAGRRAGRR